MRTKWMTLGLAVVMVAASAAFAQDDVPYVQTQNVVYEEVDGVGLVLDIFAPKGEKNGLGVVDVVSGAWHSDRGKIGDHKEAGMYDVFCGRGYTVFGVRPGSVSKFTGEEMLRNLKTGIRWVKTHASEYGVDPERLALVGASAGGHLGLLSVVTAEEGKADAKNPLERMSTQAKVVAVFFPPTDFLDWDGNPAVFSRRGKLFFENPEGRTDEEFAEQARKVSPALLVHEGLPPFLLIHGDADPMVPLQQSQKFVEAVKAKGGSAELIVKPGGAHPWPTIREEVVVMADWVDKQLGAGGASELEALKLDLPPQQYGGTPLTYTGSNLEPASYKPRAPFMAPKGLTNVAMGKPVTASSDTNMGKLEQITDGDKDARDKSVVELKAGKQWVQIDLGAEHEIYAILAWHFYAYDRVYFDVVVQVSDDPEFQRDVTTIYNNDHDNTSGMGVGKDKEYIENNEGRLFDAKGVKGRYVRLYSNGNHVDLTSHYIEVEVYGKAV